MITPLETLLALAAVALVFVELTAVVTRWPVVGMWIFAGAATITTFGVYGTDLFSGVRVYPLDFASSILAVAILLRFVRRYDRPGLVLVGFGALLGIVLVRGFAQFGLQDAGNAVRELIYLVVGAAFVVMCCRELAWISVQRIWLTMATVFLVVSAVYLFRYGLGTYAASGDRALNAPQALIVGQAGVIAVSRAHSRRTTVFAVACFAALLASQQRTAWAATAVAVLVVTLNSGALSSERASRRVRWVVSAAVVGLLLLTLLGPSSLRESVSTATTNVSTSSGTFGWRVEGWRSLVDVYLEKSLTDQVVGQPAGTGFGRDFGGGIVNVSPHNMYLTALVSLGVVGLVLLFALYYQALRRSRTAVALHALVWGLAVFSIGYQIGALDSLILGAALVAGPAIVPTRVPARSIAA